MNGTEKQILLHGLIFEAKRGSHAYGTNIEGSDEDFVGVYVQPNEEITGLKYVPQISDEKNDRVYYEIRRFYELAMKGNPNVLEIFNMPNDCIYYYEKVFEIVEDSAQYFITKKLYHTFAGYANSQIRKARGYNKKMNWDKNKVTRKGVLDFCYVITNREESQDFTSWSERSKYPQSSIGLAKVNNVPDLYSMYYLGNMNGGIVGKDSNDVQLRSIPIGSPFLSYLRFDKNAYSTHCKHFREYQEWLENRNDLRYNTNMEHGKGYDSKNMMHCIRLLNMSLDLAEGRGIVVRRPEEEIKTLLSIRNGDMDYDELLEMADNLLVKTSDAFTNSDLPDDVDEDLVHTLINSVRQVHYGLQTI